MFNLLHSGHIDAVEYQSETQRITIFFLGGHHRQYLNVPPHIYHDLLSASSAAEFYRLVIKPNFERAD
jgi:hypothetical protein